MSDLNYMYEQILCTYDKKKSMSERACMVSELITDLPLVLVCMCIFGCVGTGKASRLARKVISAPPSQSAYAFLMESKFVSRTGCIATRFGKM